MAAKPRVLVLAVFFFALLSMQTQAETPGRCQSTIRSHGGKGDGLFDDTAAIKKALSDGCAVNGENLSYRVTSAIPLPDNVALSDAIFLQDIPASGLLRVLLKQGGRSVSLRNIRIDRGRNPRLGTIGDAAAIWIANVDGVDLTDVEVLGDGLGTGILIADSRDVHLVRPHVHSMKWESTSQPENEVMVGIWSIRSSNVTIDFPKVWNLLPAAIDARSGRAAGRRNNMTDGIASSGTDGLIINEPDISFVGEGIDISGKYTTKDFVIRGGRLRDIDSFCYKVTNRQGPGLIASSEAARCGLGGYVIAGPVSGVRLVGNVALDIGANGKWATSTTTGFSLQEAYNAMPSGITLQDNRAMDTQLRPTMNVGFASDRAVPSNKLIGGLTSGYTMVPTKNF